MRRQVGVREFKSKCLHLLDEVRQTRQEILITKRGQPVARLVPTGDPTTDVVGRMRGTVKIHGDIVGPTCELWEADE